jgi:hypothetical protein
MDTKIKTVHIEVNANTDNGLTEFLSKFTGNSQKNNDHIMRTLISYIYLNIPELKDDISFHFFFESDTTFIIRSCHPDKILKLLIDQEHVVNFYVYDYPLAKKEENHKYYDEYNNPIVLENLDIYLPLFHSLSLAALKLVFNVEESEENSMKYFRYAERIMHTIANTSGMTFDQEGEMLLKLACMKSPIKTLQQTLVKWIKKPPKIE